MSNHVIHRFGARLCPNWVAGYPQAGKPACDDSRDSCYRSLSCWVGPPHAWT